MPRPLEGPQRGIPQHYTSSRPLVNEDTADETGYSADTPRPLLADTPRERTLNFDDIEDGGGDDGDDGDENEWRHNLAAGILITRAGKGRTTVKINIEKNSVFGAGVLIPQLARCTQWSKPMALWTIQIYFFLFFSLFLQVELLRFIEMEEMVMDVYGGQPYLCDFGAPFDNCPDDPGCLGPAGTQITPPRLYNYHTWATRTFMKDSMKILFPDKADLIDEKIDAGEYGAESRWCRWLCCFLFMVGVMEEMVNIFKTGELLWSVPSKPEQWIDLCMDQETTGAKRARGNVWGKGLESDDILVKVAGMPRYWKIINVLIILLPKVIVWRLTASAGVTFLMETADINDCIVNAVALNFILQIDEMLFETLVPAEIRSLVGNCEDFDRREHGGTLERSSGEGERESRELSLFSLGAVVLLFPVSAILTCGLTAWFIYSDYYLSHCNYSEEGKFYVSKTIFTPLSVKFSLFQSVMSTYFPDMHSVGYEKEPIWTMPKLD